VFCSSETSTSTVPARYPVDEAPGLNAWRRCDPARACRAYEMLLRPHVEKTQQLPPGVPAIALPKTRWGLRVLHGVHGLTAARALRSVAEQALLSSTSRALQLPDYPRLRAAPRRSEPDHRRKERFVIEIRLRQPRG